MATENAIKERYSLWTENMYFDDETRKELLSLAEDTKEIEDRLYCDLEFGTGGMRGVLGAGTNRMNKYVIRKITQGLADTILEQGETGRARGVVIAYDSRRFSPQFAKEASLVLAANNIKVYLFDSLRPTPELSFAVRHLKAIAGVMITASHNPKEYNGYKVYWEDGGQLPPDKADLVAEKLDNRKSWVIEIVSEEEAQEKGLLNIVGQDVDKAYLEAIRRELLQPELTAARGNNLKIVFSPLHGTGSIPVQQILKEIGFTSVFTVPEQQEPDTEFSTVKVPNPEDTEAFKLALEYAAQQDADVVFATDPDADRLGMYAKTRTGDFRRFTGNEIGVIIEYYLLTQKKKAGKLPENAVIVKTVATSDQGDILANKLGAKVINVLVGFKFIGEQIKEMEENGWGTYIFGFEESYGFLAGTYARDKDAVGTAALISEASLHYKEAEQKTLDEILEEINVLCGYFLDDQISVTISGKEGKSKISDIMEILRKNFRKELAGFPLIAAEDFLTRKRIFLQENKEEDIALPKSNVLKFIFEGGGFVMARPSGTEPKIKFYFCVREEKEELLQEKIEKIKKSFLEPVKHLI